MENFIFCAVYVFYLKLELKSSSRGQVSLWLTVLLWLLLSSLLLLSAMLISFFGRLKYSLLLFVLWFTDFFEINRPRHTLRFSLVSPVSTESLTCLKTSFGPHFLFFLFKVTMVAIITILNYFSSTNWGAVGLHSRVSFNSSLTKVCSSSVDWIRFPFLGSSRAPGSGFQAFVGSR